MKDAGLKEKNINELKRLLEEKRELVRKMRFDIAAKQVKNHRDYRKAKKEVARILTILREA